MRFLLEGLLEGGIFGEWIGLKAGKEFGPGEVEDGLHIG